MKRMEIVDTGVTEADANARFGDRYGFDWIYHNDALGFFPAKPTHDAKAAATALDWREWDRRQMLRNKYPDIAGDTLDDILMTVLGTVG